jgi:hypothetical protein
MTSKLGLLVLVGSIGLMACGANKPMRDAGMDARPSSADAKSDTVLDTRNPADGPSDTRKVIDAALETLSPADGRDAIDSPAGEALDSRTDRAWTPDWMVLDSQIVDTPPVDGRDAAVDASDAPRDSADSRIANDAASDGREDSADGSGVMRGHLYLGNEVWAFESCGSANVVWADIGNVAIVGKELLTPATTACEAEGGTTCPNIIYVELEGTIVSGGGYGHMNKWPQQLNIRRYLEASKTSPIDCPYLTPVYPF